MIIGEIQTPIGKIPQVSTQLTYNDKLGSWKVRWGIGRMDYKVNPGLYAIGLPNDTSPVIVTANYKMTFDILRQELSGLNAWILVLDTQGVNVWCAAAKKTFSTKELLHRIDEVKLSQIISHKTLILPQLGAGGINTKEVITASGFKVVYAPVRAKDVKTFIHSGLNATKEMRTVKFDLIDRLILIPVEIVAALKSTIIVLGCLFLLKAFGLCHIGTIDLYAYIAAVVVGCVLTPILLPWIPVRAFSLKGWLLGLIWAICLIIFGISSNNPQYNLLKGIEYLLILPSVSAFFAMNFTGSSTYTSPSGVLKEMKIAIPAIVFSIASGLILILISNFINF